MSLVYWVVDPDGTIILGAEGVSHPDAPVESGAMHLCVFGGTLGLLVLAIPPWTTSAALLNVMTCCFVCCFDCVLHDFSRNLCLLWCSAVLCCVLLWCVVV